MNKSELIDALAKSLVKAQKEMGGAIKDSTNPFFKSGYADLESVWEACRVPLTSNGLCVVQTTRPVDDGVCVITSLLHESGQWMSGELIIKPNKNDAQGMGSAITYARRYALAAMVGVYQKDDDGNEASKSIIQKEIIKTKQDAKESVITLNDKDIDHSIKIKTKSYGDKSLSEIIKLDSVQDWKMAKAVRVEWLRQGDKSSPQTALLYKLFESEGVYLELDKQTDIEDFTEFEA